MVSCKIKSNYILRYPHKMNEKNKIKFMNYLCYNPCYNVFSWLGVWDDAVDHNDLIRLLEV